MANLLLASKRRKKNRQPARLISPCVCVALHTNFPSPLDSRENPFESIPWKSVLPVFKFPVHSSLPWHTRDSSPSPETFSISQGNSLSSDFMNTQDLRGDVALNSARDWKHEHTGFHFPSFNGGICELYVLNAQNSMA